MAKVSGLGDLLFVDGYDLSGDVGSLQNLAWPSNLLPDTGINKAGMERMFGLEDALIDFNCFWNDEAVSSPFGAFTVLKAKPAVGRIVTYFRGSAIGNMAAGLVAKQASFDWARGADASLLGKVQCQADSGFGLELSGGGALGPEGGQLTAGKRTDTTATLGTAMDSGIVGGTAFGLVAYLHVFSHTGTNVQVTIEDATTAGGAYTAVTGGAFANVLHAAVPTAQRIATGPTQAIRRSLRVTTTGTFTECTFAVMVVRFLAART